MDVFKRVDFSYDHSIRGEIRSSGTDIVAFNIIRIKLNYHKYLTLTLAIIIVLT